MDHGARYQLLDHATDEGSLWDTRHVIRETRVDGQRVDRHRERSPEELSARVEQLLRERHIELYEETDPEHRVLRLDEALAVVADERNWYTPIDLSETERPATIYALSLTESGGAEFRLERSRADQS